MQPKILVPVDFSDVTLNAAIQSANLAELMDGRLILAHAVNHYTHAYRKSQDLPEDWVEDQLYALAGQIHEGRQIDIQVMWKEGTLYDVIPALAKETGSHLVALSGYGTPGLQKLSRTKTLRILSACPLPVMVFGRKISKHSDPVIVPINLFRRWEKKADILEKLVPAYLRRIIFVENHSGEIFSNELEKQRARLRSRLEGKVQDIEFAACRGQGSFVRELESYARSARSGLIVLISDEEEDGLPYKPGSWDEPLIFNKLQLPVLCISPRMKL